jgi:hypothetical protein
MQRQALGGAMKTGTENIMGGLNMGQNEMWMRGVMDNGATPSVPNAAPMGGNSITNQGFNGLGQSSFGGNTQPWGMGTNNYGFGQPATPNTTGTGLYQFGGGNANYYQFQ